MPSKSTVTCNDCHVTLVLPEEPQALALATTEFIEWHNLLQHYHFAIGPKNADADAVAGPPT